MIFGFLQELPRREAVAPICSDFKNNEGIHKDWQESPESRIVPLSAQALV